MTELRAACEMGIAIDAGIQALIPPLTPEEQNLLQESLANEGCREPVVVWQECGVLLDGHNRYEICTRQGIEFEVVRRSFESREAAELWVITNQLGRRNLAAIDKIKLAIQQESLVRAQAAANSGKRTDLMQNSAGGPEAIVTREAIAKLAGVSHDTVSKGRSIWETGTSELIDAVRRGDTSINAAAKLAKLPQEKQVQVVGRGDLADTAKKLRGRRTLNTGNHEWHTPDNLLDAAREVIGVIDLDPATNAVAQAHVQAAQHFTERLRGEMRKAIAVLTAAVQ